MQQIPAGCIRPRMSIVAEQLDERLRELDPQTAARVERMVREILAITDPAAMEKREASRRGTPLASLADHAEPMGVLTNADIDCAVYGS